MIGILCPLKKEFSILKGDEKDWQETRHDWGATWYSETHDVCAALMGIGEKTARQRTSLFLDSVDINIAIEFGIAGALADGIRKGDIVLAHEVIKAGSAPEPLSWKPDEIETIADRIAAPTIISGTVLTTDSIVKTQVSRDALAREYNAIAVTMETYSFVQECATKNVPCYSIRVISDLAVPPLDTKYITTILEFFMQQRETLWEIISYIKK